MESYVYLKRTYADRPLVKNVEDIEKLLPINPPTQLQITVLDRSLAIPVQHGTTEKKLFALASTPSNRKKFHGSWHHTRISRLL